MPGSIQSMDGMLLLEHLYASLDDGDMTPFLEKLRQVSNSKVAAQMCLNTSQVQGVFQQSVGIPQHQLDGMLETCGQEFGTENSLIVNTGKFFASGAIVQVSDHASFKHLRKTSYFQGFMNSLKLDYTVGAFTDCDASRFSCLNLTRELGVGDYQDSDIQLLKYLMPHLQRVSRLNGLLSDSSSTGNLGWLALNEAGVAAIQLNSSLASERVTDAMVEILVAGKLFHFFGDQLSGRTESVQRELDRLSKQVLPNSDATAAQHAPEALVVDASGKSYKLTALLSSTHNPLYMHRAELLIIATPVPSSDSPHSVLSVKYDLTPAECRCVLAFLDTHRLPDLADQLHISYNTVRAHLRSIFYKTGVHSQAELVALLAREGILEAE